MTPIPCTWDGESFVPLPRFAKLCDKEYVVGERYILEAKEERSAASHRHYFASVNDAWMNLPEHLSEQFPSAEHLRKYALCKAGFADERSIVCASKAEAQRVAAFIRPMDTYAIVVAQGATVKVWTAQSQSMRAMGKDEFQRSKTAVLDILAGMLGTDSKTLQAQGEAA